MGRGERENTLCCMFGVRVLVRVSIRVRVRVRVRAHVRVCVRARVCMRVRVRVRVRLGTPVAQRRNGWRACECRAAR